MGKRRAVGAHEPRPAHRAGEIPLRRAEGVSGGRSRAETRPAHRITQKARMTPLLRFLIKLALVAAVTFLVLTFVLGVHIHHGNRMYPFVMDGDLLITYKLDPCYIGDVVLYRNPQTGEKAVSRIAAMGENEVEITEQGGLLINGYTPAESVFYPTRELEGSPILFPYRMSADGIFLLDDYREIGLDSRAFGQIGEDAILGKVAYVFRRRGI